MKKFELLIIALVVSLSFASCTKYDANAIPLPETAAQCNSDMQNNAYKGYIDDPYLEGTLALTITESGTMGSIANVNITGFLSVNNQEFCCHSTGMNTLEKIYPEYMDGDYGALSIQSLMCTPMNGGFQQFTLKLGVDCGGNTLHKMYLKTDKTLIGCFTMDNPVMQNRIIPVVD